MALPSIKRPVLLGTLPGPEGILPAIDCGIYEEYKTPSVEPPPMETAVKLATAVDEAIPLVVDEEW